MGKRSERKDIEGTKQGTSEKTMKKAGAEAGQGSAEKKRMKPGKVLGRVVLSVLLLAVLYLAVYLFGGPVFYAKFYKNAEKGVWIPGYEEGFVPQGVTALEGSFETLICGYMEGEENSRIYRVNVDGQVTQIRLLREDGSPYTGHAGGFTIVGKYIYISNAQKIFVLDKEEVLNAWGVADIAFIGHFDVPCRASFCSSDGEMLYVGEYHKKGYETEESHKVDSADGVYQAMTFAYRLSYDGEFGIEDTTRPAAAYATCDIVQGFAMLPDGTAALSCSAGFASSHLRFYDAGGEADSVFPFNGKAIPLYVLDCRRATRTVRMPRMSEDLEFRNGRLYIGFEGGAKKFGARMLPFSMRNVMLYKYER